MPNDAQLAKAGALALLGSGEYLDVMNDIDRLLLATVGGVASAQVVLLPTASGLEPGAPERWNQLGQRHFQALGAKVMPLSVVTREDAEDTAILEVLREANVFYFSGGSPLYLIETLRGTRAWATIVARYREGAVLAGCSAGAIMLGEYTFNHRAVLAGQPPAWQPALGVIPGLAVIAHFDRFRRRFDPEALPALVSSAPVGTTLIGIDEDTALLRLPSDTGYRWQVYGRQTVSILRRNGQPAIYAAGETVPLEEILHAAGRG